MSLRDERSLRGKHRVLGVLGPFSSCFTLAWLASHRDRLRTLLIGGKRLSVLVIWDAKGSEKAARDDADVQAIRTLVYGGPR